MVHFHQNEVLLAQKRSNAVFSKEELQKIYDNEEQRYIEEKYEQWINEMKFAAMNRKNYVQCYNSEMLYLVNG